MAKKDELKAYIRSNPGTTFIIAFQVLIVLAGVLLIRGDPSDAYIVATYAFYALVIGIAIQVALVVRGERKHARTGESTESPAS